MKTSLNGINLIKRFEGLRLESYMCAADKLTVGWGHRCDLPLGTKITMAQAMQFLDFDLNICESCLLTNLPDLNQNQFDALIDFVFNIGTHRFLTSHLYHLIFNDIHNDTAIRIEFLKWVYIHVHGIAVKSDWQLQRRSAEVALFFG
jgi:lysozyme